MVLLGRCEMRFLYICVYPRWMYSCLQFIGFICVIISNSDTSHLALSFTLSYRPSTL